MMWASRHCPKPRPRVDRYLAKLERRIKNSRVRSSRSGKSSKQVISISISTNKINEKKTGYNLGSGG